MNAFLLFGGIIYIYIVLTNQLLKGFSFHELPFTGEASGLAYQSSLRVFGGLKIP